MGDKKFKIFEGKVVRVWLADGFLRQGKVLEVYEDSIVLDDRKDGITYLNSDIISKISEVQNG